jgi:hypothetical protein
MIIDYQNGGQISSQGVLPATSDFVPITQPLQDPEIVETEQATGTTGGVSISLTGNVND